MAAVPAAREVALVYVRVSRFDEDERERRVSPQMQRENALALRESSWAEPSRPRRGPN